MPFVLQFKTSRHRDPLIIDFGKLPESDNLPAPVSMPSNTPPHGPFIQELLNEFMGKVPRLGFESLGAAGSFPVLPDLMETDDPEFRERH